MYYAFIELFTNRMKVKVKHLQRFFSSDASGGIVLIIAAALAMVMANTSVTSGLYHSFLETPVQLRVGALEINKNMLLWINDALMAVFFLLIGLEVKRELIQGSLASRRQAVFPVIAALGGMIVPGWSTWPLTPRILSPERDGRSRRRRILLLPSACWRC